ncbi:MAG: hypothetical protein EON56_04340 [Alphaproteobacteria bacterium]|nr:MAG: hypothetical protein EON56_04340 [Alphaproteobacteria bacterium]
MTAWIYYVINSDEPADIALLDEHRARSRAYAQTMHWIVGRDRAEDNALERLRQENDLVNALQDRIHARGLVRKQATASPAFTE